MVDEIDEIDKGEIVDIEEAEIEVSAEALMKLFEEIEVEGESFAIHVARTPERSEDRWGLRSDVDAYRSIRSIDIIIDEFGNRKITVR